MNLDLVTKSDLLELKSDLIVYNASHWATHFAA